MASNPPTPAKLPCDQCGFVNEAERVYCHNCGSKLDRSLLPGRDEKVEESPEKARKRITKITNPKAGMVFQEVKTFLKVEIYAVVAAVLFLISQKPDGVPELKKESMQRLINSDMMEAMQAPKPSLISFTEDEVNQYLKKTVKPRDSIVPGIEIPRVYTIFTPDVLRIGTENSLLGYYSIYIDVSFHLEVNKEGKFTTEIVGGNLGRLAVDPRIMKYSDWLFQGTWDALKRERGQMDKMAKVEVKKGEISLVTKGAGR